MDKTGRKNAQKVVVAMSGGVDSSVAAALLKGAGFNVEGVFMKLYDSSRFREGEKRAKKIAGILRIPIRILDLRKEFKKIVIGYFLRECLFGRTPNPCVVCNKEIKFGLLLEKVLALDFDFVATGHYARTNLCKNLMIVRNPPRVKLIRGKDKEKDQSYFLWQLNQKQLRHVLFPVGNYTKAEVQKLARKFKLPVFNTPESMEICFVQTTVNDFLKRHLKPKPGPIVEQVYYGVKEIVGQHQGLWFYTIGQRKGIKLAGGPYWVLDKDQKRNSLIVTRNERDLYKKELVCEKVNWIRAPIDHSVLDRAQKICALVSRETPKLPLRIKAEIRYQHKASPAVIYKPKGGRYGLVFNRSQKAVTPGQSVVFYKGEELLGGGTIAK